MKGWKQLKIRDSKTAELRNQNGKRVFADLFITIIFFIQFLKNLEDIIAFAVDGTDVWTIKENENKIKGRRASGGSERSGIPSDHERKN